MTLKDRLRYYKHTLGAKEKDAAWYDAAYSKSTEYRRDHEDSVYLPVWQSILGHLREAGARAVLDLGCGPGQFAAFLHDAGIESYLGIDFSATAIALAREKCPVFDYRVADLNDFEFASVDTPDVVVATEVLEHIKQDVELLAKIPAGTRFVGSVPSFNAESHVRYFPTLDDVRKRYARLFDAFGAEACATTNGATLYVLHGVRR